MMYHTIMSNELTAQQLQTWAGIQRSQEEWCSPYFHPEFTQAVAAARDDVHICLLEHDHRLRGFFPFHRSRTGVGRPIGLGLSDYHGVIAEPGTPWSVEPLLRACKLIRFEFDHLLASQTQFSQRRTRTARSPITKLDGGYEAFVASRDKSGRKQIREIERKHEKLETEVGPVRFVEHSTDTAVLEQLMAWKSEQCRRTGTVDYFALSWCTELIRRIHATQHDDFGGLLSCLYAGDTLVAAHFAMRSARVWHSWFPAYNPAYQQYSPGLILLLEMVKAAAEHRIAHIDFGRGVSLYKTRFMTDIIEVAEGCAEIPSILNQTRQLRDRVEQWSKASPLKPLLKIPGQIIKHFERKGRYR